MILRNVKVEHTDEKTGLVLKKITTSEGDFLNHIMAVNNTIYNCEEKRVVANKPVLLSPCQVNHIQYAHKKLLWDMDSISPSKNHASKQNRIYTTFLQRNKKQWNGLCAK